MNDNKDKCSALGSKLGVISDLVVVFIHQCRTEDISMLQEARPSESHLEIFKRTVSKIAQCSLAEERKETEGEVGEW